MLTYHHSFEALKEQEVQHQRQMKEIRKTSKELRRQRPRASICECRWQHFLGMDFANVPEMQKCVRWFLAEVIQHRVVWQKLMEPHRDSLSEVLLQPAL